MLVTRRGRAIDAHDMVWRFNQAPVLGFAPYVGSKTEFEMLNSAWVKQLLEGDDAAVAQFAHIGESLGVLGVLSLGCSIGVGKVDGLNGQRQTSRALSSKFILRMIRPTLATI